MDHPNVMLETLLRYIDRIYDLGLDVDIREYLIGRETCKLLSGESVGGRVLVRQTGQSDEIEIGVYLSEETLSRLGELDCPGRVEPENLAVWCTAVEEVSHFAYLLWNARHGKPVTQLELEIQGEVDKYVLTTLWSTGSAAGRSPSQVLERLFGSFELRAGLDGASRDRYRTASRFAHRYCCFLVRRFLHHERIAAFLSNLRRFYRLSQGGKMGYIRRAADTLERSMPW